MKKGVVIAALVLLLLLSNKVSAAKFIANEEALRLKSYQDSSGVWTLGYGSTRNPYTGLPIKQGDTITEQQALEWLKIGTKSAEADVLRLVKVPLNSNMLAALTSFVYNIGATRFAKSTMLRLLNAKAKKEIVAEEFGKYIYSAKKISKGLINRRKREKELFLS